MRIQQGRAHVGEYARLELNQRPPAYKAGALTD